MYQDHYEFSLLPLPYPFGALAPQLNEETIQIHQEKHHRAYVDQLNSLLAGYPRYWNWTLEQLILCNRELPAQIRTGVKNNAGGVYNHNLYFTGLGPNATEPGGSFGEAVQRQFGGKDNLRKKLKEAGLGVYGSGWAWLVCTRNGALSIVSTANQDTPLERGLYPLLALDVWEHAYYLQYQNRRGDYIDQWFERINWEVAQKLYNRCSW